MFKLKRKLEFKGHVYFQAVRPELILEALNWLKTYNALYEKIKVDLSNIDGRFTCLEDWRKEDEGENTEEIVSLGDVNSNAGKFEKYDQVDDVSDNEEDDDPQSEYQSSANETCLQSRIPNYPVIIDRNKQSAGKEVYSIAPGEDKKPVLFPKGRFGYTSEREVKLSPIKYFNA